MLSCAREVSEVIEKRYEALIDIGARVAQGTPELRDLPRSDVAQIVSGFVKVLAEAMEDRGNETFLFYTETVITGARAKGDSPASIVYATVMFTTSLAAELVQHVSPENRVELIVWLGKFTADYVVAVMNSALSV